MNQTAGDQSSLQWSDAERIESMAAMQDLDFSSFLDIGDLDLTAFSPIAQDQQQQQHHHHHHQQQQQQQQQQHVEAVSAAQQAGSAQLFQSDPMMHDFSGDNFELPMSMGQEQALHAGTSANGQGHDSLDFADHLNGHGNANGHDWAHQQQQQQQQQEHVRMQQGNVYQPPQHVPPTPNSYDMHGNPGRYLQHQMDAQTRAFLEQRYQLKKDDMSFTPLVSPAVTPQDSHFHTIPEYTIPGAYFSPLTSPALQAQNGPHHMQHMPGYHPNPSTAASSVATSPIDLNVDVDMTDNGGSLSEAPRRTMRKAQLPRSTGPVARVRQSPIVKPQSKRKTSHLASVIPSKEMDSILREGRQSQPPSAGLSRNGHFMDSSGTESISPEPLSEALMGPPPRPASAIQSPSLVAQTQSAPASAPVSGGTGAPATPASLMSLQRSQKINLKRRGDSSAPHSMQPLPEAHDDSAMLDDFTLPPAANTSIQRPAPDRIISGNSSASADATPRMNARKTPKLGPSGTPLLGPTCNSVTSSPSISAVTSPSIAATPNSLTGRKMESKSGARSLKKRGSIGGPMISPAIRPKISPSIKPLLPEGAKYNESQQALLLASKSNYTHILEGTLLPGVTYPESLSSGLTSKRTSHKIAEQGRRNRINDALKEMQALLPKLGGKAKSANGTPEAPGKAEDEDDDKDGSKAGAADSKTASSKAATVESAIEYIKVLQQERARTAQMLKEKDDEMAALREKLKSAGIEPKGKEAETLANGETK